jgi:hypothetical protein
MNCGAFKYGTFLLLLLTFFLPSHGQGQNDSLELLLLPDAVLRSDIVRTERVIDLVNASVIDSVVEKNKQRLKGFGGWIAQRTWARYWVYYTSQKQKYVGSSSRPYKIFDGMADEMDINIFIMPHLPQYILMVRAGFDEARNRPRPEGPFRFDSPEGYPLPPQLKYEDRGYITVECEVTPKQEFADVLHEMFLPTHAGAYGLDTVRNFGVKHPSFGMTGVWCMDCNHNCRPEIHPIEWLWWLDLSKDRPGSEKAKSWMVSLMVDGSNRFRDWSASPISGEIAIPFAMDTQARNLTITLQHIASDPTLEGKETAFLPEAAYQTGDTTFNIPLALNAPNPPQAEVRVTGNWPRVGTHYWISDLQAIPGGYAGYFHIATSVTGMMALRVTFD